MGLFGRRKPAQPPVAKGTLRDPGRPDDDLKQLGYGLFHACGLNFAVYGPVSAAKLVAGIMDCAPVLKSSTSAGRGVGKVPAFGESMWTVYEGPTGALFGLHVFPGTDTNLLFGSFSSKLDHLRSPLAFTIGTVGASLAADVVSLFDEVEAVPMWELPQFADLATSGALEAPQELRQALAAEVMSRNGESFDDVVYKVVVDVGGGRTQLLFFGVAGGIDLMSPVTITHDEFIPEVLHGMDLGGLPMEVLGEMVVLRDSVETNDGGWPTVTEILERGIRLAAFADSVEAQISPEDAL